MQACAQTTFGACDMWLFIPFVVVPIIEIALFIQIGGAIGLLPTLAVVVLTALAGTILVRAQGLATLARLQQSLAEGGDPTGPIAHGALILVSGVLLLTPGFFTDGVGFALLLPPVRSRLISWGAARLASRFTVVTPGGRAEPQDTVIETEYYEIDPDEMQNPGSSGWTKRP